MIEIFSDDNPIIKHVKQLSLKKYRERNKEYIIEGVRTVRDAYINRKPMVAVLYCDHLKNTAGGEDLLRDLEKTDIKIYKVKDKTFKELSDTENPQGIMAIMTFESRELDDVLRKEKGFYVVLDRVQDPGNMGTIIRTADAAGADAVFLTKGCVDVYNMKTIRATMGSIFHLPVIHIDDMEAAIKQLKQTNVQLIAATLETENYHYDIQYGEKVAIVIGNEANGISPLIIEAADHKVKIPIMGEAESLNASIAGAILMYEVIRQKKTFCRKRV
ncbi:MAG: TrmH family RNA methyltransferase [Bacillota bacterium]